MAQSPPGRVGESRLQKLASASNRGRQHQTMRAWLSTSAATLPLPITPSSRLARGFSFGWSGMGGGSLHQCAQDAGQPGDRGDRIGQGEARGAGMAVTDADTESVRAIDRVEGVLVGEVVAEVDRQPALERFALQQFGDGARSEERRVGKAWSGRWA